MQNPLTLVSIVPGPFHRTLSSRYPIITGLGYEDQGYITPVSSIYMAYTRPEPSAGDGEHCGSVVILSHGSLRFCVTKVNPTMNLTVSDNTVSSGDAIGISGKGFPPDRSLSEIKLYDHMGYQTGISFPSPTYVGSDGSFTLTVNMPNIGMCCQIKSPGPKTLSVTVYTNQNWTATRGITVE